MLNRGNELKDLLKTQDLAVLGAKNELKKNSLWSAKDANQSEKAGFRIRHSGVGGQEPGVTAQDSGAGAHKVPVPASVGLHWTCELHECASVDSAIQGMFTEREGQAKKNSSKLVMPQKV
jgi:hypothetical protein